MEHHDFAQGSPAWFAHRGNTFNASDAPAMLGVSPYKTREQLLAEYATGITKEVDAATQRRFDNGHRFEALARPVAEKIIGKKLYPVVGSEDAGLSRRLGASFDGLTMDEVWNFEHKSLNNELRECMEGSDESDKLPLHYRVQMEQQHAVSGCEKTLFMASSWDENDNLIEARHCWYQSDMALRQRILDGWRQFETDLAEYKHIEATTEVIGKAPENLPALRVDVTGMVTYSNLDEFKQHALGVIGAINTDLQTDEDFANADKTAKWLKDDVEDRLEAVKKHALSQTASIDDLFRAIDSIKAEARDKRLSLENAVKTRKEAIKLEIVQDAIGQFKEHVAALQSEITGVDLSKIVETPYFGESIKGLKTFTSMRNKLSDALANGKITADAIAKDVRAKLAWCKENAAGMSMLFPDLQQIISKPMDDFTLTIQSRIDRHKRDEEARLEQEREKIRNEEAMKSIETIGTANAAKNVKFSHEDESPRMAMVTHNEAMADTHKRNALIEEITDMLVDMPLHNLEAVMRFASEQMSEAA